MSDRDICHATTASGDRCSNPVKVDDACWIPSHQEQVWEGNGARKRVRQSQVSQRVQKGEWEAAYLEALARGHTKASAAALAGVDESTPYKRADGDAEFARQQSIAYERGTARLEEIAFARITDPEKPGDSVLRHLLAVRGVNPKQRHEHSGPDGAPLRFTMDIGNAGNRD